MLLHFFSRRKRAEQQTIFRNFIFGVEDSLVSTVGLLSGVAAAQTNRQTVVLTGIVLIFVEAFSMGVGSFLSEETAGEIAHTHPSRPQIAKASLVMFSSYLLAGLIPLSPYLFLPHSLAIPTSIAFSLLALFILGLVSAHRFHGRLLPKAFEMLVLGGLATLIGIVVGSLLG